MKIKIGDKIIDCDNEPIMIIFDDLDEKKHHSENISHMDANCLKYCVFPSKLSYSEIKNFMKI